MTGIAIPKRSEFGSGAGAPPPGAPGGDGESAGPQIQIVHDAVPGRVRLRVEGLKGSAGTARRLERILPGLDGVRCAQASPLTGTVLLLTEKSRGADDVSGAVRALLAGHPEDDGFGADPGGDDWHRGELPEIAARLQTSLTDGLAPNEVRARLRRGANVLAAPVRRSAVELAIGQVRSAPVALLAIASVVSLATGGLIEAIAIMGVVALNAAIGYTTERRAEKTIESLSHLDEPDVAVIRGGREATIPVESVVPGDLLVLSRGMLVPADARLVRAVDLTVSEAALVGESLPASKSAAPLAPGPAPLAERRNMVFRGTLVTGGSGVAVVTATGMSTQVGLVQRLAGSARPPETPSQKQLRRLGKQIAVVSIAACALSIGLGWLRGLALLQLMRSGLTLAVAAVPEGLPTLATTTLALGVEDMRRRGVLVRSLHALETLASANVACFDKTGTLTRNEMKVTAIACGKSLQPVEPGGRVASAPLEDRLFRTAVLASDLDLEERQGEWTASGSSTERALAEAAVERGAALDELMAAFPRLALEHRSEARRIMTSLHARADGGRLVAVKGSPLEVLDLCAWEAGPDGGRTPLTEARRAAIGRLNADMADQALRVLGVADRELAGPEADLANAARELTWIGMVGMSDPLREGAPAVLEGLRAAGVRPVIITGDQSATARALARQVRLSPGRDPVVVDASELEGLGPEDLARAARDADVFARVSPEQKLTVLRALQGAGAVVAMVGDGVNDSPALRAADVGIALGEEGTTAAQEVADVVLEKDDLSGLLIALERGRSTRTNIRKAIRYLLSTNASEILVMLGGLAIGFGEALSPMQILWINLVSDVLPGLGLALEPPEPDALARGPASEALVEGRPEAARLGREAGTMAAGALAASTWGVLRHGARSRRAQTMTFASLVGAQLMHGFTCRSSRRGLFTREHSAPNRALLGALGVSAGLQAIALVAPPLRTLLGIGRLDLADLCVTVACGAAPFLGLEAMKAAPEGVRRSEESGR